MCYAIAIVLSLLTNFMFAFLCFIGNNFIFNLLLQLSLRAALSLKYDKYTFLHPCLPLQQKLCFTVFQVSSSCTDAGMVTNAQLLPLFPYFQ